MISKHLTIGTALIIPFLASSSNSALAWWKEEHTVYSQHKGQCVSSPPFSSEFGPVVLRYDWFDEKPLLHIDLEIDAAFKKVEDMQIRTLQIDDGASFNTYSNVSGYWSVTSIFERDRFFNEFAEGKKLLMFNSSGELATVDLNKIESGPRYFVRNLQICNEDQRTGGSRGPHYK